MLKDKLLAKILKIRNSLSGLRKLPNPDFRLITLLEASKEKEPSQVAYTALIEAEDIPKAPSLSRGTSHLALDQQIPALNPKKMHTTESHLSKTLKVVWPKNSFS